MTRKFASDENSSSIRYDKEADVRKLAEVIGHWTSGEYSAEDVEAVCHAMEGARHAVFDAAESSGDSIQRLGPLIASASTWESVQQTIFLIDQRFDRKQQPKQPGELLSMVLNRVLPTPLLNQLRDVVHERQGPAESSGLPRSPRRHISPLCLKHKRELSRQFDAWCRNKLTFVELVGSFETMIGPLREKAVTTDERTVGETIKTISDLISIQSQAQVYLDSAALIDQFKINPHRRREAFESLHAEAGLKEVQFP